MILKDANYKPLPRGYKTSFGFYRKKIYAIIAGALPISVPVLILGILFSLFIYDPTIRNFIEFASVIVPVFAFFYAYDNLKLKPTYFCISGRNIQMHALFRKIEEDICISEISQICVAQNKYRKDEIEITTYLGQQSHIPYDKEFFKTLEFLMQNTYYFVEDDEVKKDKQYIAKVNLNYFGGIKSSRKDYLYPLMILLCLACVLIFYFFKLPSTDELFINACVYGVGLTLAYIAHLYISYTKVNYYELVGNTVKCYTSRKKLLDEFSVSDINMVCIVNEETQCGCSEEQIEIALNDGKLFRIKYSREFFEGVKFAMEYSK